MNKNHMNPASIHLSLINFTDFQFSVTFISQIRRVNHLATISLNLLLTLCASNLVFIVGVQTSKNLFKCEMIAVLLHYFHLSTAVWGLCHSFSIYDYVVNENVPVIKYNNLVAFGASAVFVLVRTISELDWCQNYNAQILMKWMLFSLFLADCDVSSHSLYQATAMKSTIIVGCPYKNRWFSILWYQHRF